MILFAAYYGEKFATRYNTVSSILIQPIWFGCVKLTFGCENHARSSKDFFVFVFLMPKKKA